VNQVPAPLLVRMMVPETPTATPMEEVGKLIDFKATLVGIVMAPQEAPALVVPNNPVPETANPLLASRKKKASAPNPVVVVTVHVVPESLVRLKYAAPAIQPVVEESHKF